jgi:hypothetical protein
MKKLLFVLCIIMLPVAAFSQTKADYEQVVGKFMKFYNAKSMPDSIINMYADMWKKMKKHLWTTELNQELLNKYGTMQSYKYLELYKPSNGDGGGDGLAFFKVVFTKSIHVMGIALDKKNKLVTFRFDTSSPHIDSLLKKNM